MAAIVCDARLWWKDHGKQRGGGVLYRKDADIEAAGCCSIGDIPKKKKRKKKGRRMKDLAGH